MNQTVTADIPYTIDTGEKLVNETFRPEQHSQAEDRKP